MQTNTDAKHEHTITIIAGHHFIQMNCSDKLRFSCLLVWYILLVEIEEEETLNTYL